ncbi:MAG TPA: serine hydrolase [Candidatus Binatia bacterium]|nr:serine hydrolase [Candidatus Binatia bacterium]
MAGRTRSRWLTGLVGLGLLGLVGLSFGPATAFLGLAGALDRVTGASAPPAGASGAPGSPAISTGPGSSPAWSPTVVPGSSSPGVSVAPSPFPERPPRPLLGPRTLDRARLVRLVEDFRRRTGSPGLSVAVRWPDGTAWTITSGLADLATGRPVTAATPFAIASVTKTFTAALVLRLVGEGRIGLDDPVGPWLPDLDLPAGITVRMLLDHTSGLGDPFLEGAVDRELLADRSAVWTAGRFLAALPKPRFAPGRGWAYSNANYVVLGLLVERLTGRPYAALLRSTFFEPLGLSTAIVQPGRPGAVAPAHGYRLVKSGNGLRRTDLSDGSPTAPFTSVVTAAGAAGNVAMGALDLARWGAALYGGGLLRPDLLAAMVEDASRTAPLRPKVPYGLGVQVVEIAGQPTLGHSGRFLGARAVLRYLVRSGITIAVLSNQSRSDIAPLVDGIVRLVLPPPVGCGRCG